MKCPGQLLPLYKKFIEQELFDTYLQNLSRDGLIWWFNMEIRRIANHLEALAAFPHQPVFSNRILLLREIFEDEPTIAIFECLYSSFLKEDDREAAYACVGAAIGSIWSSGREFSRNELWWNRSDSLLKEKDALRSVAIASLLGYKALAEQTWLGNLKLASISLAEQQHWAEKSNSVSLRLFHAATSSSCFFLTGNIAAAELLMQVNLPLFSHSEGSFLCRIQYQSCLGLYKALKGNYKEGISVLQSAVTHQYFESLPLSIRLHCYIHYLYVLCVGGDLNRIHAVSQIIMAKTILPCNDYNLAYLHICLGLTAFRMENPRKALLHGEEALRRGRSSNGPLVEGLAALLYGQALAELSDYRAALSHLQDWEKKWESAGLILIAAAGALELSSVYISLGRIEAARKQYDKAYKILPRGESLPMLYRPKEFIERLKVSIFPQYGGIIHCGVTPLKAISIQTFGEFCLRIKNKIVYDRTWKGDQSKKLLKAIIVFGGVKVSLEKLAYFIWPEHDGDKARNNLKMGLSRLRRVGVRQGNPPLSWIVVKHKKVSLSRTLCRVDSLDFLNAIKGVEVGGTNSFVLKNVLEMYTGDFLSNDESETWIINHRAMLNDFFVNGVLEFSVSCLREGKCEVALPFLERALYGNPLHEGIYAQLMEMYINMRWYGKALVVYNQACEILLREMGIVPGPRLSILAGQAKRKG